MFRKLTLCLALALSAVAVPAMAADHAPRAGQHAAPSFPVPAAAFRDRVEARLGKERDRVEKHLAKKNPPPAQAEKERAVVGEKIARVEARLAKVTEDGSVSKEEAREVHREMKELFHHPHRTAKKA